ncbi:MULTISPECIES: hypothetical protein [Streptomyces]|uniref:Uncharacterized protein n=1 Tax=Streptomyces pratisoli TaxID=3139917 RepID=A0ACC6QFR2_9ACTN|nr:MULTISPECIES: hypothetical protein [unclassified Streptomyces]MCX4509150.1 hypothetical protein [Streptomyces sp. NBC_01619]
MRRSRFGIGTALAVGALAVSGLAFAPAAMAVQPADATAEYDCGGFGGGDANLHAVQSGGSITITVATSVVTPLPIGAGDATTTLVLSLNGSGTATFSGSSNPAIPAFSPFNSGPLTSTASFAPGDSLDSYFGGPGLTLEIFGTTVPCEAVTSQSPGPFVAD